MKKIILILGFVLPLMVIFFSSNSSSTTPQNPKIGTFELYRTVNESDIFSYFGNPSQHTQAENENGNGLTVKMDIYFYNEVGSKKTLFEISTMENRIEGFSIKTRNTTYAINGKLMVGDNISKVDELAYEVKNKYGEKCLILVPPIYRRGTSDIYYYFEIYYDTNNIIKRISFLEDIGV